MSILFEIVEPYNRESSESLWLKDDEHLLNEKV